MTNEMQKKLQQRLQKLKSEFEEGHKILVDLEAKQANLRETLLRISGAIQVLEEVLNETPEENGSSPVTFDSESSAIASPHQTDILT